MQFENDGILLWYGTSDAPTPDETAIEGSEILITIGVQPPDASNVVEVSYRVNQGSTETVVAKFLRSEPLRQFQYFRAYLPAFKAGDRVEYKVICQCAGRQVPAPTEEEHWASSFQVVAATSVSDEMSDATPELLNLEQLQESDNPSQPEKSQPEEILTNSDINNNNINEKIQKNTDVFSSSRSKSISPTIVAKAAEPITASTITISDDRLNSFYNQNQDFDILQFNFINGQTNQLKWENVEQETTLELLKKYQRLLRINPNEEIAKQLLDKSGVNLDSAHAIASMTEEQFIKMLPGNEAVAREMHKKAIDIKAKTQLLWANMRDTVASPHFRSMRVSTADESDNAILAQDIPSYQEMFGDLDYLDCEHCGSIFSAAAYVVDLMRIVDQYITEPNQDSISQAGGLTLNQRRPDLAEIELTCDNTNSLLPSLQIINRILEARVKTDLGSEDGLQSLATEKYPFTLPFNFYLEQIRSYLQHLKTDLGTIYEAFDVNELAIAREHLGLSLEEYNLITNSETNEAELKKLYGIEDLENLSNVEVFLKHTGLSRTELPELLEQNLYKTELEAGLAHNFYINQVLENNQAVQFPQITPEEANTGVISTIENLTTATLDRIHRFIRLAKKLNWSFTDLDWVLTSINATHPQPLPGGEQTEIDEEAIKTIAKIKQLQTKYKLPLDVLCSFWHNMKTIGIGSNLEKPQSLFDRVFNNPFKAILGDKFFRLQDEIQQIEVNNLQQEVENNPVVGRILAALRLNINQLTDILRALWGAENTVDLTVEKLSQLFRISQILRLVGLNIEEYQLFLSFLDIESISTISIDQFSQITELAQWLKESQIQINELDYIITGGLNSDLDIGYSETDVIEGMQSLWNLAVNSLLKPSDFVVEEIEEEQALAIFDELLSANYIQEVTSNYENILQVPLDNRIAIVLNSEITNDTEFAQEISQIFANEQLDENQLERQIKSLQEILQQAAEKHTEELEETASFFAVEADLAISLLDYAAIATQTPDYVRFLLTPVPQDQQEWLDIVQFFQFLSRVLILTQKLELTPTELKSVVANQEAFGINELSQLSINNIQIISHFKELIAAFGDDKNQLIEYFASVSENEKTNNIEELANITGWKSEQISLLLSPPDSQANNQLNLINLNTDSHKKVEGITKLKQYFSLSRQLGVNASWFTKLLKLANLPVAGESANWQLYQSASQAVREITKAKYDDEQWVKVSEKLEGELNERKRDVLTAWIIWQHQYENLRHLSQELLIDVETSSAISISIIKEATLAIQTYLHRCRMGLEPGVEKLQIPEIWWQWIMNYRVWEANRKVFLYPENFLDPSLRKIKSPIFQELEEELLQSEIQKESVEKAYQNYFEKFNEIAQLKPAGGYRYTVENNFEAQDTLYLFGRTATEPYTYYYRKCINPEANTPTWEAWEKIDLVINSEQISATYAFNKLFIFWVETVQIEKTKQQGNNQETETETKATIKYSFQKFGNQWIQSQTLAKDIVIENYDQRSEKLWRKVTALPIPAKGSEPEKILTLFGDLSREDEFYVTQDQNQGIFLTIDLLQENTKVILENQPSNSVQSILPTIVKNHQLATIATDNVLYDNYADYVDDSVRSLVAYWSLNERSGNVVGDLIGNKDGILRGNPQWETVNDFPGADSRRVLQLDGNGDYIEIPAHPNPTKAITIAVWAKSNTETWNNSGFLLSKRNAYVLHPNQNSKTISFRIFQNGMKTVEFTPDIDLQQWHHYAGSFDGNTIRLYIDGQEVTSSVVNNAPINQDNGPLLIGKDDFSEPRFFNGQIAEVSIWDVALNASILFIPLVTKNISKSNVSVTGIDNQPGWFTFDNGDEAFLAFPQQANGFPQIDHSLRTVTQDDEITLSYEASDISNQEQLKFTFTRLNTTTIRQLSQKMLIGGLDNLLTLDSQLTPELNFNRFSPSDLVDFANTRRLDFDGPNGIYFWEIFFHIPFLVANTLNSNQRFEEAQKWYHYIFNPTNPQNIFNPTNPEYIFNPTNPTSSGLGAYFPIDEGSGTETRDLTGSNNGTLEGNPQWETVDDFPGVISRNRNVLKFDGEDDYVEIDRSVGDFKASNFSIQLWFKTAADSGTLIGGGSFSLSDYWIIYLEDGFAKFAFNAGEFSGNHGSSDLTVNDGNWHHLTAVRNQPQGGKLYLDGVLVDEFSYSGTNTGINILSNVFLGKPANNTNYFQGQIAEVSIWNLALSGEQIFDQLVGKQRDRFWHYLPFRGNILQKIQDTLTNDGAIKAYNDNPFDPHAIAQLRIGAYEKAIVMKYIDNLLDWGDQLFAQDNRESINEATLLYFLAYDLLGEEPENLGKRQSPSPKTFQQIKEQYENEGDEIPQFLIDLENRVNDTTPITITSTPFNDLNTYFCAPENEQFIAYWERVEDRLFKIRHSLSIEGIRRQLALFQPPIDPAQLVRAVAGGIQPLSVVSQLTPAVPNYRFDNILERAKSFTSTLTQLGSSLLSALEKKDAEEIALLRSTHEQSILQLVTTTKEQQLNEANETLNSLNESLASAQHRYDYYRNLLQNGLFLNEQLSQDLLIGSFELQVLATGVLTGAAIAFAFPTIFGLATGGQSQGAAISSASGALAGGAFAGNTASSLVDKMAIYERRDQEWEFQEQLAEIDVQQIEHQIEAQKIRVQIAEQELRIHEESIKQSQEIEAFLKGKFTNQELYQWMLSRLSILYFQTYKIALDMAMASQSAYQYELTKDDTFINFNYWDSLKKGLLAGESLMLGLNQLEKAYVEGNVRRFEIEKTISLLQLDPQAFQKLKNTGKCEFELSEKLFDFDFPGHYARQIKTIAVSIPAVVGPYQNISATLTQTSNKTLLKPDVNAVEYLLAGGENPPDESILRSNWRRNQKIAISRGAMDNGLFELNFYWDTRYLPFEATGAVSTWELSLPKQTNRIDFDTISDVIITLSYTALDGGDNFRRQVTTLEPLQDYSEAYYYNLKQAFPAEWHTFMNLNTDTNSQKLNFQVSEAIIPPHIKDAKLTGIIFKLDAPDVSSPLDFATITLGENNLINQNDNSIDDSVTDNWFGNWIINFDLTKVPQTLKKDGLLNPEIVNNIELILTYQGKINWAQ